MTPDELLQKIQELINKKETIPSVVTFVQLKRAIVGDEETRESFKTLVREKRIKIREGKNDKLIEILGEHRKD